MILSVTTRAGLVLAPIGVRSVASERTMADPKMTLFPPIL